MQLQNADTITKTLTADMGFQQLAVKQLRAAAESEMKYLSFLSHDLNNNLSALKLHLDLLKDRLVQSNEFGEELCALDLVQQTITRTTDGMRRLLARERIRKQHQRPRRHPVNLHELATSVARQYREQSQAKGLAIAVKVASSVEVHSDCDLIALVLQNLIGNAVKYSRCGTVRVRCEGARDYANRFVISVTDEGPGIPADQLGHIFAAFRRGEDHDQDGVGLGLTIAAEAARLLGAELSVESTVGVGSQFQLALPTAAHQN